MEREIKFRVWDSTPIADGFKGIMVNHDYAIQSDYLRDALNGVYPIMQFTGLKDKKGIEIYEGDILDNKEVVKYLDGCFCTSYALLSVSASNRFVIGNIHENPELL